MSPYAATAHRNNNLDVGVSQFHSIINKLDLINIEKIVVLLRLAESFDKSMNDLVEDIDCIINNDSVILRVVSETDIQLEIEDAKKASGYFCNAYDKDLIIEKL